MNTTKLTSIRSVRLSTFEGVCAAPDDVYPNENYWLLIGKIGKVVAESGPEPHMKNRVLVQFEVNLSELGLENHNEQPNALWILKSDLQFLKSRHPRLRSEAKRFENSKNPVSGIQWT